MINLMLSFVQLAAGVTIAYQPCPAYLPQHAVSCYVRESRTIYLNKHDRKSPFAIYHEFGHVDDDDRLTEQDHITFKAMMGYRKSRGWWQEPANLATGRQSPGEEYADNYAYCALKSAISNVRFCEMLPMSLYAKVYVQLSSG
jgi:hypothetical protein